jgi:preprotein translocase subunit YajC
MLDLAAVLAFVAQNAPAPEAAAPAGQPTQPSWLPLVVTFGPIAILFYFMLIRPQQKRDKERRSLLAAMKKNDHVVTIGGIKGVVSNVNAEQDEVEVRVDDRTNTRLTFTRSAIARIESPKTGAEGTQET